MKINEENKKKFQEYQNFHTNDGGKCPKAYALTELILDAVKKKTYFFHPKENRGESGEFVFGLYDVIAHSDFGGNVHFGVLVNVDSNVLDVSHGKDDGKVYTKTLEG